MKTIEQAAREYENKEPDVIDGEYTLFSVINAFVSGAEFAQRWIPVDEESPAEYDYVLAKSSVGDVYVASFSAGTFHTGMPHKVNITHWRLIEYK